MSPAVSSYAELAERLQATAWFDDPWLEGQERFRRAPVLLSPARWQALQEAAAGIAAVHDEVAQQCLREPGLLDSFFGLTAWQAGMWRCSAPHWHGIARADVFWTADGPKVCELNSDTPSGEAEAVFCNQLLAGPGQHDPNAALPRRFVAMVEAWARSCGHDGPLVIGILYPTELPEDLSMVAAYRQWLHAAGHRTVLGSPWNVGTAADGRATLFDTPCDAIVRHYKTDWFGERLPVADDEPLVHDRAPLAEPLLRLLQAAVDGRTAIVNPFGAVLLQNKRTLAFCWERKQHFTPGAQRAIERWLPETVRLETVRDQLWAEREQWVLKSDYGCEGNEVVIGPAVTPAEWDAALSTAIVRRWVAQRYFEAERGANGELTNHGVYLIGGAPAGVLARVHGTGPTDGDAQIAPVFVQEPAGGSGPVRDSERVR
ncbi:MAG: glutathionylspermidine synthase family protein [Planctomycetes bacterium]|jgi:glutathionylspermidine synthase|nr:glutathionylspermidine synthase family protein [Planctomycetota bacterium]